MAKSVRSCFTSIGYCTTPQGAISACEFTPLIFTLVMNADELAERFVSLDAGRSKLASTTCPASIEISNGATNEIIAISAICLTFLTNEIWLFWIIFAL